MVQVTGVERALGAETERLIAVCRVMLAVGGVIAAYLDPQQPAEGTIGYVPLGAYVLFSLILLPTIRRPLTGRSSITVHVVEVGLICLIILETHGPTSPYFVYFTFVLFTAALRWQGTGALITGATLSLVLMVLTVTQLVTQLDAAEVNGLVLRNLYMVISSVLFAVLGDEFGRSRQRLERLRLARAMHDGILQTLTAVRIKLHLVAAAATGTMRANLLEAGQLLEEEQRHLRTFVEQSRNPALGQSSRFQTSELHAFLDHLEQLWGCEINLATEPDVEPSPSLGGELRFILAEAVANAVLHGKATRIIAEIVKEKESIVLKVEDNGAGLGLGTRTYDHHELAALAIGPRSLRDRVAASGGSLQLTTSPSGVELQFRFPIME